MHRRGLSVALVLAADCSTIGYMDTLSVGLDLHSPFTWLAGSVAAAVIVTNLAYLVGRRTADQRAPGWQIAAWLVTALFFVLLPLAAWQKGVLSPFYLGIGSLDWVSSLMLGAPVAAIITAIILAGWLAHRRMLPRPRDVHAADKVIAVLRAPLEAALLQWHWAFYRALAVGWVAAWPALASPPGAPLTLDPTTEPLYWGSWLGLLSAGVEWLLNPFARAGWRAAGSREAALRQAALAVATTGLFVATRHLWLCLACHMAVEIVIAVWLPPAADANL